MRTAHDIRNSNDPTDHRMANLRGFVANTINRKKHKAKHTAAPKLQAMKMSMRSHRLKAKKLSSSSRRLGAGKGAPGASWVGNLK